MPSPEDSLCLVGHLSTPPVVSSLEDDQFSSVMSRALMLTIILDSMVHFAKHTLNSYQKSIRCGSYPQKSHKIVRRDCPVGMCTTKSTKRNELRREMIGICGCWNVFSWEWRELEATPPIGLHPSASGQASGNPLDLYLELQATEVNSVTEFLGVMTGSHLPLAICSLSVLFWWLRW